MKLLNTLILSFCFILFGCNIEEIPIEGDVSSVEEIIENGNNSGGEGNNNNTGDTGEGGNSGDEDDHDMNTDNQNNQGDESVLQANVMLSESAMSLRLGETKSMVVTIAAEPEFSGDPINISVDRSSLNDNNIDDGTYVKLNLASQQINNLAAGTSQNVMFFLETETMAPSFSAQTIKVIISQGSLEKEAEFTIEVVPEIEVNIISAQQTPYTYNRGQRTCIRTHGGDGVQVIFSNKTNDFPAGGGPCIHTGFPLQHCNIGTNMDQNDIYLPPKVTASAGVGANNRYYNHNNGNDNNNRRLYFNVVPGTENNDCPN